MSSQAGFVTKNGNLSTKTLKRIFKDKIMPFKKPKKAKAIEAYKLKQSTRKS
jgi:hypothetical protein